MQPSPLKFMVSLVLALFVGGSGGYMLGLRHAALFVDQASPNAMRPVDVKTYRDNAKQIMGIVTALSPSSMAIEAIVPDPGSTTTINPQTPSTKKQFTFSLTPATTYENKKQSQFAAGDQVNITATGSIYAASLVAKTVSFYDPHAEAVKNVLGDTHQLFGTVRSISGSMLFVEADVVDTARLNTMDLSGSYVVPYVNKTYQVTLAMGTNTQAIKVGSMVRVTTMEDIYTTNKLTAKEVALP